MMALLLLVGMEEMITCIMAKHLLGLLGRSRAGSTGCNMSDRPEIHHQRKRPASKSINYSTYVRFTLWREAVEGRGDDGVSFECVWRLQLLARVCRWTVWVSMCGVDQGAGSSYLVGDFPPHAVLQTRPMFDALRQLKKKRRRAIK